jgi:sugar transferase (PEP-CTERM/EpsH1 system associated)
MNILFITKELPYPPDSGFRNRTFHLIKGLASRHKVSLVCFGDKNVKLDGISPYCVTIEQVGPHKKDKTVWKLLLSLFCPYPYSVTSRFNPNMKAKVEGLLRSQHFDLFICDSIYQALHMPDTSIFKVITEHNIESSIMLRYARVEKNPLIKLGVWIEFLKMRVYEHATWKKFDLCLVCSDAEKHELQKRIPMQKADVIPNGVDLGYFTNTTTEVKKHLLVYVGQMNWRPNIDAVVYFLKEMYPHIKADVPDVSFSIVGNNPPEEIKKLAQEIGANTTGYVPDTRPFVSQAEVFVVPLRIGGGTRLKILEAMAMGKAIVSTSIGCEGIGATHEKNILIADSREDFAKSVIRIFNDTTLRDNLGRAARKFVEENYSWENIGQRLNTIIEQEALYA